MENLIDRKIVRGVQNMKTSIILVSFLLASAILPAISFTAEASSSLQVTFATNPIIVAPGTNGYLEVILESIGTGDIENIDISARSWDPSVVIALGNWEVYVGDLDGGDSTSVLYEFKVPSTATPGLYQVIFDIDYSPGVDIRQTAMVKVEDSTILDLISVTPNSLNIGETTTLVFNFINNGGSEIYNIIFSWQSSSDLILPLGSDNRIIISSIAAGNSTEIPVDVVVSPAIAPGVYPLTITMDYYDRTGTQQSITSEVGIIVGGTTDFDVSLQGSTGISTTLAIANIGANTAYSVIVRIPQQMNFRASGASSSNMGNLDAGDYTLATFQIAPTMDATNRSGTWGDFSNRSSTHNDFINRSGAMADNTNLIVEISYTGMLGIRRTVQKEVTLGSGMGTGGVPSGMSGMYGQYGSQQSDNTGMMYIVIGVVGIIAIVAFIKFGKRKKK